MHNYKLLHLPVTIFVKMPPWKMDCHVFVLYTRLRFRTLSIIKVKRAFFRHDRRTAPKFSTHVRIDTLTLKKN